MVRFATTLLAVCTLLCSGCISVQPCAPGTPPIVIKNIEKRPSGLGTVIFPAGTYTPDFQSTEGIYYAAPTKLAAGGFGVTRPMRGGLFVPFPSAHDQRQAAWYDQQENAGGLLTAGTTSTTRLWHFNQTIAIHQ